MAWCFGALWWLTVVWVWWWLLWFTVVLSFCRDMFVLVVAVGFTVCLCLLGAFNSVVVYVFVRY